MKIVDKIESLIKTHNDVAYTKLWTVSKKIVEDTIQHNKLITAQMSNYDLHDETHSEKVIDIIENLLGGNISELTCYELILLYLSAYLHDSAMALPAWEYDILKAVEGTDELFDNTLEFRICNDFKKEHSFSGATKIINVNKSKLFDFGEVKNFVFAKEAEDELIKSLAKLIKDYECFRNGFNKELNDNKASVAQYINMSKLIRSEFIRQTHHLRVVDNIYALKKKIETAIGAYAADNFIQDLALICKGHGEPIGKLCDLAIERENWLGEKSNVQFVAMLLRLGDVIHFSSDRAPLSLFAEKRITDETSYKHWNAKFQDLKFNFIAVNDIITLRYTAYCSSPEIYYFIQDYINWIDNELDNYFMLKQHWEQIKLDKLKCYSLSISNRVDRTQINYKKEAFIPKPNMHFVLNQAKILELLMGVQLYKEKYLCLRELYQNALDATKCIMAYNKHNGVDEKLTIEFGIGEEIIEGVKRKYIYCLDHGTGMNEYIIDNFLLHIGNSYYKSKEFYRKNTGWEFDVNPTSQFGIGILSGYMLADKIGITTIYYEQSEIKSFVLEGVNEHFYYINPPEIDTERIGKHGTIVKLFLKDDIAKILNSVYWEKLPVILESPQSNNVPTVIEQSVLENNLHYILCRHICVYPDKIFIGCWDDKNILRPLLQSNSIFNLKNYPEITKDDLRNYWSEIHFLSGQKSPYLEVIEKLDYIDNYNITVQTDNIEIYSHISLPKKGIDSNNLNYYSFFHFVGKNEGSILVDGIHVESKVGANSDFIRAIEYNFSNNAIINFVGEKRPLLSVDRKTCVKLPELKEELEEARTKFVEQLKDIICAHIDKEKINIYDKELSLILNIVTSRFPSLTDEFLHLLCNTSLFDAPVPEQFGLEKTLTVKSLMQNENLSIKNVDFRIYQETYRRILVSRLINVKAINIHDTNMAIRGAKYCALPMDRYSIYDGDFSLASVAIKADTWDGIYKEYDLVSSLWPIINPFLFNALNDDYYIKEITSHCRSISNSGNGIAGIARLNPTLINPSYGIGMDNKSLFDQKRIVLSNPDSIAHNFWLFELTNHREETFENNKSASLFAFIAPRELNAEEAVRLKEYESSDPVFVKGVKEGWSILFLGDMQEYIIRPGIVKRDDIISQIPESWKNKQPQITYYNTDGTKTF